MIGQPRVQRYQGVEGHVGRTPLIRIRKISELTGCEILGKAEFMNPGGSVKDRAALGIIPMPRRRDGFDLGRPSSKERRVTRELASP